MHVQSYLFFNGRCEEAIGFYQHAVGATDVSIMRNREAPEPPPPGMLPPGSENKVLHASFRIGETEVMASDGDVSGKVRFEGFRLSLAVADEAEAKRRFDALAQGGKVDMPLAKTSFSPSFGMLTDRFGVGWMVIVFPR